MTSEEYGQYIDDFELGADVMPGESLTDYIERRRREFESKADGGSIGIEVLFKEKMKNGGRVPMVSGGALKSIGSGIMKLFSKGDDAVDLAKQEEIFRSGNITAEFLEDVDPKVIKKFITTRDTGGPGGYGMYKSFDDMPNGLKAAELISRIKTADGGINYEAAELFIGKKLKGDETIDELISMVITEKKADGGRVGLFMGGDPLTGQALQIYNSMKGYNFSDQEIADALSARGLYTAAGSGTTQPAQVTGIIGSQLNQGDDGPKGDFGIFGNLDKSTAKDFNVEVYDEEFGDFVPTTITGYKNVNTGLYQDKFGKNLQPMFSNTGVTPGFLGVVSNMLGLNKTVGGFVPGSIRGKYDGIRDIFNKQKKQQQDIIRQQQEEKARQEQLKRELEALAAQGRDYGSGGGRDESLNRGPGGSYTGKGDTGTPGLDSIDYDLKDGGPVGLATMFTRRR